MRSLKKLRAASQEMELVLHEPPTLPESRHARIRVAAAGICGTDLHILDGTYPSSPPVTLGHEVAGIVEEISDDVDPSILGVAVAIETFYSTCGACRYCRGGRPNLCAQRRSIGSGADGGFSDAVIVPAPNLHRLPNHVTAVFGALCEPLACVCHSLMTPLPAVAPADRVLVVGPGTVGLLAAQVARAAGGQVTVAGAARDAARLAVAEELGFGVRHSADAGATPEADVVIECSGSESGMALGLERVRKAGRYVQIGQTADRVSVPLAQVSFKELNLTGGFASTPAAWSLAINLLSEKSVDVAPLITSIFPLEEWRDAFRATREGTGVKMLLSPDPDVCRGADAPSSHAQEDTK